MNRVQLLTALSALALASGLSVSEVEAQVREECQFLELTKDQQVLERVAFRPANPVEAACSEFALSLLTSVAPATGPVPSPGEGPY